MIERVPTPVDNYAKEMFQAIVEACKLPNSETRDRLLYGLSHAVVNLHVPSLIIKNNLELDK